MVLENLKANVVAFGQIEIEQEAYYVSIDRDKSLSETIWMIQPNGSFALVAGRIYSALAADAASLRQIPNWTIHLANPIINIFESDAEIQFIEIKEGHVERN